MARTILAGTRKGLFVVRDGDDGWDVDGPHLKGWEVFHAVADPRTEALYAATNSWVYGATVHRSDDGGRTWERAEEIGLPDDTGLTLAKTWHVEPGPASAPDTVYVGGDPAVLLRSDDRGATWESVRGIVEHPTRDRWEPGAGGLTCHSIQIDPTDDARMYVGISAAGVFRSDDGGETWTPKNKGTAADFMPEKYPELGQCVHKLLVHPARPERLWQQNHCGVYRSDDRGESWERLAERRRGALEPLPASRLRREQAGQHDRRHISAASTDNTGGRCRAASTPAPSRERAKTDPLCVPKYTAPSSDAIPSRSTATHARSGNPSASSDQLPPPSPVR